MLVSYFLLKDVWDKLWRFDLNFMKYYLLINEEVIILDLVKG